MTHPTQHHIDSGCIIFSLHMHRHIWQPEIPSYDVPSQETESSRNSRNTIPSSAETLSETEQMQDHTGITPTLEDSYTPTQPPYPETT